LTDDAIRELKAYRKQQAQEKLFLGEAYQDNGLVFCKEDGTPIDPREFTKRFQRQLAKAGLPHVTLWEANDYGKRCLKISKFIAFSRKSLPITFCVMLVYLQRFWSQFINSPSFSHEGRSPVSNSTYALSKALRFISLSALAYISVLVTDT